jgi:transcriptional regulator with XRE-family HTH domain
VGSFKKPKILSSPGQAIHLRRVYIFAIFIEGMTSINLKTFLSNSKVSIQLNKQLLPKINQILSSKYGSRRNIARKIGCSRRFYALIIQGKRNPSSEYVLSISKLTKIKIEELVSRITPRCVKNYSWLQTEDFPIRLDANISALIGYSMGDGGISQTFAYTNTNPSLIQDVISRVGKLPIRNISRNFWEKDGTTVRHSTLVRDILLCAGAPKDNKITQGFKIPDWIMKGNNKVKQEFLRSYFDDEGTVSFTKRQISLSMSKNVMFTNAHQAYFAQLKYLLHSQGIDSVSINFGGLGCGKNGVTTIKKISIYGTLNFKRFSKKIGFLSKNKNNSLKKLISSSKYLKMSREQRSNQLIKILSEEKETTAKRLSERTKMSHKGILLKLSEMEKDKLVIKKKVSCKYYRYQWRLP